MPDYETLRTSHEREYRSLLTDHFARLNWSEDELRSHRQDSLRSVLAAAKERAPWHRRAAAHINAETVTEADLPSIPTMGKHDLMENFDGILTDARLSRVLVEQHIDALTDDAYLLDEHHAVASGGSSGTRGVFVYDWQGWLVLC